MFGWKLNKTVDIGQIMTIIALLLSVVALRYKDLAYVAEVDSTARARDVKMASDLARTSDRQTEILRELRELRLEHNDLNVDYREHKARTEK